jgi:hypothetical protein
VGAATRPSARSAPLVVPACRDYLDRDRVPEKVRIPEPLEYRMRRHTSVLAAGALLGLGICMAGVANGNADDKDKNPALEPILKLAETLKKDPAAAKKEAEAMAKKLDFEDVMHVFKPRAKGGVGFDAKADAKKDGIETKLLDMVKPKPSVPITKDDLKAKAADYERMAEVIQAIMEVTQHVSPPKGMSGKGPKEWKQYIEDTKKGSKEMADAVKTGDPAKVKTAANNLNSACNNCHTDFR